MPKYAVFFSYSAEAWAAMIDKPSDRAAVAAKIAKDLGGSLECFYFMFGPRDAFAIFDVPDSISAAALSVTVGSTGALQNVETRELITSDGIQKVLERAKTLKGGYTPATG